uniref:MAM domain-containing protein n=1 Tax=Tetranychus urticae TaxID=32264 RepID=T1KL16_TETUR
MILNVSIISILILVLIVPSSANVCNFIGYACSLNNINSSYFTQLDYLHDSEIGDSWLLKNNQSPVVSGRLVSDLLIPPYGPSPHCLMIRYAITGEALISLIVITQSDDYEVRFCYISEDFDGDVKKISVPFSMYSHTRITIDISMSSYVNSAFYLESFWVVRDDCYPGFKERMDPCPEYIEPEDNGGLTIIATGPQESIVEMKSLHNNDTTYQWNGNVTTQLNNSTNSSDTVNSQMPSKIYPSIPLISKKDNVSTISSLTLDTNNSKSETRSENRSKYITTKNNVTIQLLEPLNLNETIVQDFDKERKIKEIEANQTKKANSDRVNVTLAINPSIGNYSGNVTGMDTETTDSNDTLFSSFLPFITTESWRSEMMVSNSSNETSEFLEGKMSPSDNKTNIIDSRLGQSTLPPTQKQMLTFAQSNSSAVAGNITAASTTSTEYSKNILDGIKEARNGTKVSVKPTLNETAGVLSETESSYNGTRSTIVVTEVSVNRFTPLSATEITKLDFANSSSSTQDTGKAVYAKSTQIGNFVNESMNYNSSSNNQFTEVTSTPMMQLGANVSTKKYPSSDRSESRLNETKVTVDPNQDKSNFTTDNKSRNTTELTPGTPTSLQHQNNTAVMLSAKVNSTISSVKYTFSDYSTHENQSTTVNTTEVLNVKSQNNHEGINTTELIPGIQTPLQLQNGTNVTLVVSNTSLSTAYSANQTVTVTQKTSLIPGVFNYTNSTTTISSIPEYSPPVYSVTKPSNTTDKIGKNGTVSASPFDSNEIVTNDYSAAGVIALNGDKNEQKNPERLPMID